MAVDYDLVVIGGGSGGLVVASAAAQLKAKVALVEKDRLGGDCLWYGCVPSKSLIHASRVAYQVKNSQRFGIYTLPPEIDFTQVMGHVQKVIDTIQPHDSPERFRGLGVEVIFGNGQFVDRHTFEVNGQRLKGRAFVIATGSRPALGAIAGLDSVGFLTNEQVFSLTELPNSLVVIGAGPVGCELAQAFARFGTKVTLIASRDHILPKEDPEAAQVVKQQFEHEGIRIIKKAKVEKVDILEGKKSVLVGGDHIIADEILVAIGREPNITSLNLDIAGIEYSQKGIKVNQKLQTTNPRIYACGDVIGGYQFTHVAGYEASIIIPNALLLPLKKANYRVIPWATFTDPELARVGLTEQEARAKYNDVYVLKQDFSGVDRAQAEGVIQGFAKIITRKNGEILGATMVGNSAGELINEVVLAMSYKLKVSALSGIHIYPTLSEVNSKASLLLTKQKYAQNQELQNLFAQVFRFLRNFY